MKYSKELNIGTKLTLKGFKNQYVLTEQNNKLATYFKEENPLIAKLL